jgi:hypothetical protein
MSAVRHRMFNTLTALSLLLCILAVISSMNTIDIDLSFPVPFPNSRFWPIEWHRGDGTMSWGLSWARPHPQFYFYVVRWWAIWATSIMPAWWFLDRLQTMIKDRFQTSTRNRGYCHKCGYDLRATPDRCPECGSSPRSTGMHSS